MKLEHGSAYIDRLGNHVIVELLKGDVRFKFIGRSKSHQMLYDESGNAAIRSNDRSFDLVSKVVDNTDTILVDRLPTLSVCGSSFKCPDCEKEHTYFIDALSCNCDTD